MVELYNILSYITLKIRQDMVFVYDIGEHRVCHGSQIRAIDFAIAS